MERDQKQPKPSVPAPEDGHRLLKAFFAIPAPNLRLALIILAEALIGVR